jgi:hypothetical protein
LNCRPGLDPGPRAASLLRKDTRPADCVSEVFLHAE